MLFAFKTINKVTKPSITLTHTQSLTGYVCLYACACVCVRVLHHCLFYCECYVLITVGHSPPNISA